MIRSRGLTACGAAAAVLASMLVASSPAGAVSRINAQRLRVTVQGTQFVNWSSHDYNPDPNCGGTSDANGTESLKFSTARPVTVTAIQVGRATPYLFIGRNATGTLSAKGTFERQAKSSFQPNPGGNGCSSGTGGGAPPSDCGRRPFDRMALRLEYVGSRQRQRPTPSPYTTEYVGYRRGNLLDLTYDPNPLSVDPFNDLFERCAASGPKALLEAYNSTLSAAVLMGHRHSFSVRGGRLSAFQFAGIHYSAHLAWTVRFTRLRAPRSPLAVLPH
jgi:hypothetical protein